MRRLAWRVDSSIASLATFLDSYLHPHISIPRLRVRVMMWAGVGLRVSTMLGAIGDCAATGVICGATSGRKPPDRGCPLSARQKNETWRHITAGNDCTYSSVHQMPLQAATVKRKIPGSRDSFTNHRWPCLPAASPWVPPPPLNLPRVTSVRIRFWLDTKKPGCTIIAVNPIELSRAASPQPS